jgi:hypothetical protein
LKQLEFDFKLSILANYLQKASCHLFSFRIIGSHHLNQIIMSGTILKLLATIASFRCVLSYLPVGPIEAMDDNILKNKYHCRQKVLSSYGTDAYHANFCSCTTPWTFVGVIKKENLQSERALRKYETGAFGETPIMCGPNLGFVVNNGVKWFHAKISALFPLFLYFGFCELIASGPTIAIVDGKVTDHFSIDTDQYPSYYDTKTPDNQAMENEHTYFSVWCCPDLLSDPEDLAPTPMLTLKPATAPTPMMTTKPVEATTAPSKRPVEPPTGIPTTKPVEALTTKPMEAPIGLTTKPVEAPTAIPTMKPVETPTAVSTLKPEDAPTAIPLMKPVETPTAIPIMKPVETPTAVSTLKPEEAPTALPTMKPEAKTVAGTTEPSPKPVSTSAPTEMLTLKPVAKDDAGTTTEPSPKPLSDPPMSQPNIGPPTNDDK